MEKLQRKARVEEVKEEARVEKGKEGKSGANLSVKRVFTLCALTCALIACATASASEPEPQNVAVSAISQVIAAAACVAGVVGSAVLASASQFSGPAQEVRAFGDFVGAGGDVSKLPCGNPFLPPPSDVLLLASKTRPDINFDIMHLINEDHPDLDLFTGLPHKDKVNRPNNEKMRIKFQPGKEREIPRPRKHKTPKHLLPVLKKMLEELLNKGFIKPSKSPFSSACMLIVKPHQEGVALEDLKYRLVVDLRMINNLTVPMHHPIPNITGIWHTLAFAKYLSVLDLESGFYQESLREDDQNEEGAGGFSSSDKTAFSTELGHFQFVGSVMGARNTPAFFQSKVELALRRDGLLDVGILTKNKEGKYSIDSGEPCCTPFIDDLIVYSMNREQHIKDLRRVFKCLSKNQYYVNKDKCHFGCKYVLFCGGVVGNGVLAMDPIKVKSIDDWVQPVNITELRAFLGMANYLKMWFKNYSDYSGVLTNLLKKGKCVSKDWGPEHTAAFEHLKAGFKSYPILRLPDFEKQFFLLTDSCATAIGGCVAQEYEFRDENDEVKKVLLPVAYHSRKMSKHEVNYSVREQECLAIHSCFKKFEYLLVGSKFEVVCKTDHSSLKQVQEGGSLQSSKRLARWAEYLGGFAYSVTWVPGITNYIGDGISRSLGLVGGGTKPVTGEVNINIPEVSGVSCFSGDNRMDNLDYSKSKNFSKVWELLCTSGVDALDLLEHPEIRYYERIGDRLFYLLPCGGMALCIPENHRVKGKGLTVKVPLREALLRECHDSVYIGHRGIVKTYAHMRKLFYWKSLLKDIGKFIRSCATCMRAKASNRGEMGALRPQECPAGPMQSVTMDFIAGMPAAVLPEWPGRAITQALVMVCRFTKKGFILPMPGNATTQEVAKVVYEKVFREHGWPLELISDRDVKFTSAFWKELFNRVGTKLSFGYSYHQRFDGQTEVMNRVIKEILRCYIDLGQTKWVELLPDVVQCINNSVGVATGMSPNEIYYGRKHLRPVELKYQNVVSMPSVAAFLQGTEHKRHVATEMVRRAIVSYSVQFNKRTPYLKIDPRIQPGSLVFVNAKNIVPPNLRGRPSKKMGVKRAGPFKVIRQVSRSGFELDMPGYRVHKVFHAHSLTPFSEGLDFEVRKALKTADHVDSGTGLSMWRVSGLDERRQRGAKHFYFVLYEGYGVSDGEWLSRDILLQDCPELVAEFDLKRPLPASKKKKARRVASRSSARIRAGP